MSYLQFVDDAVGASYLMLADLTHPRVGYPPRCATCNMTWLCDARRRADELKAKWADPPTEED